MKKFTIILIILIVLAGVGFVFYKNSSAAAPKAPAQAQNNINTNVTYSLDEVAKHSVKTDCWIALNGKVYNATEFIASGMHNDKILNGCGKGCIRNVCSDSKAR